MPERRSRLPTDIVGLEMHPLRRRQTRSAHLLAVRGLCCGIQLLAARLSGQRRRGLWTLKRQDVGPPISGRMCRPFICSSIQRAGVRYAVWNSTSSGYTGMAGCSRRDGSQPWNAARAAPAWKPTQRLVWRWSPWRPRLAWTELRRAGGAARRPPCHRRARQQAWRRR